MRGRTVSKRPSSIPGVVQLPGGIRLTGVPFRIATRDAEGRPATFELLPAGTAATPGDRDACVLFADEDWIRSPGR